LNIINVAGHSAFYFDDQMEEVRIGKNNVILAATTDYTNPLNATLLLRKVMTSVASSGTGEDTLQTLNLWGTTLGNTGGLKIRAVGTVSGTNNTKTVKFYWSGSSSYTVMTQAAGDVNDWTLDYTIMNVDPNSQRIEWRSIEADGTTLQGYETDTVNTTDNQTLKLTGECADPNDTITQTMWTIEYL